MSDFKESQTLDEIESILYSLDMGFSLTANKDLLIQSVSDGRNPSVNSLCFLEDTNNVELKEDVLYIVTEPPSLACCIVTKDPRYLFIRLLEYVQSHHLTHTLSESKRTRGVHPLANIHPEAVIEEDVVVEQGAVISAGCILKKGTVIGENSIIRENTVIGCDGISLYKSKDGEVLKFPHLSGVEIASNVEVGANSVIVRGTLQPTIIEDDVVIGSLCNIGHGVIVKSKVWMSVGVCVGGNCVIESGTSIGLGVSIKDNLIIASKTSIGMGSVVIKSTGDDASYFGNPAKKVKRLSTGPIR